MMKYKKITLGNRVCGVICEDTYISVRQSKFHYYVKGGGYPVSNVILKMLKEERDPPVQFIQIEEQGSTKKRVYRSPLQKYLNAVLIEEGGFEQQRCVPLKEMELVREEELNKVNR
jgi:hypothetical protein